MWSIISNILDFISQNTWNNLRKFVVKDDVIVYDDAFKVSTKYSFAVLMVLFVVSTSNRILTTDLKCSPFNFAELHTTHHVTLDYNQVAAMNEFCWVQDVFLVAKALQQNMAGVVKYPGVSQYTNGKDRLIKLKYYKSLWLIVMLLSIIAILPYYMWVKRGYKRICPFIDVGDDAYQLSSIYVKTIGLNGKFTRIYIFYKMLATISPALQMALVCLFVNTNFVSYGYDFVIAGLTEVWPDPMDQMFPKMSICELNGHTPFGQLQVHPMLCQLPANATNAYLFLIYWTWLVAVFIINVWSILELLIHALPGCRTYNYTKNERVVTLQSFGFGDWLLMNFIKKNISDYMFRSLLKSLQKIQIGEADKSCDSDDDLSCVSVEENVYCNST